MSECVHGLEFSSCATCSPRPDDLVGGRRRTSASSDSLTGFFELLDAPLRSSRWSWGAVRERDGVVFLRVWEDLVQSVVGSRVVHVYRDVEGRERPGLRERRRHLERVRDGAACFLVFCTAEDPNQDPRKIAGFNSRYLWRAGQVIEREGDKWIEVGNRVPADEVIRGIDSDQM